MIHSQGLQKLKNIEIWSIVLTTLLYLFRSTVPILKFPFLLLFFCLVIYSLINYRSGILSALIEFIKNFYLSLFLLIILIAAFILSNKLYLVVFKDGINALLLISLFFFMLFYLKTKSDLDSFLEKLFRLIIFFALIISVLLLFKILNITPVNDDLSLSKPAWYSSIISLSSDYNFALVPVLFGMISVLYVLSEPVSPLKKGLLTLMLVIFSISILLSGSRRGFISLGCIIVFLLFVRLFKPIKWDETIKTIRHNSKWFINSIVILIFLLIGFVFIVPVQMKRNTLNTLGISIISYRNLSAILLSRYSGIFSKADFNHFLKIVWNENPDSLNLDSYWSSQSNKTVFPLTGKNVEILPGNSIGYKMDKTSIVSRWGNNAYSFTNISDQFKEDTLTRRDEFYFASIYCYVSKDFDGSWARISAGNGIEGKVYKNYDLRRKGEWQKLSISFRKNGYISPVYLLWTKQMATDFYNLKGHIIFADPELRIIKAVPTDPDSGWGSSTSIKEYTLTGKNVEIVPPNTIGYRMDSTCNGHTWNNNAYSYTEITSLFKGSPVSTQNNDYTASVYCYVSDDFDGTWANISAEGDVTGNKLTQYDLSKKGTWQKIEINFSSRSAIPPVYLYWAKDGSTNFDLLKGYIIFAYPEYKTAFKKDNKTSFVISSVQHSLTYHAGLFPSLKLFLTKPLLGMSDQDPVRRWAEKLISEDTTYYGYRVDLLSDTITNKFTGYRLMRWKFAGQLFLKEYNLRQKLFGGGFNFLNWFGFRFLNDKKQSDYPHNPFLSVLLYSGMVGLILYLFFLYKVIYFYIKYFSENKLLGVYFLITLFFSFFSAGSPFDPPIMGFFVLIPFLLHAVYKKTEIQKNSNDKVQAIEL